MSETIILFVNCQQFKFKLIDRNHVNFKGHLYIYQAAVTGPVARLFQAEINIFT